VPESLGWTVDEDHLVEAEEAADSVLVELVQIQE
jgi:hypothetical protein